MKRQITIDEVIKIAPEMVSNYKWYIEKGWNVQDRLTGYYTQASEQLAEFIAEGIKRKHFADSTGSFESNLEKFQAKLNRYNEILNALKALNTEE